MASTCWKSRVSRIADHILLLVVVAPLVSVYWCGMFYLVDHYVFPSDYMTSIWFTCILGYAAVFVCHLIHERLTKIAQLTDALYNPLSRFYSILLIIVIVFQWRGFWYILDHYLGPGYVSAGGCLALGYALMAASGCSKSMTGVVPFILIADDKTNYFIAFSKYAHLTSRNPILHFANHLYSVFYIHPSIILVWRGLWHIQDFGIFPDVPINSGVVSLGLGIIMSVTCYIVQWPLNSCVKRLPRVPRFLVEQLWRIIVSATAVFYWRGSWVFWELMFKGDLFTMWFVTITAAFLLCALNCWSIATLRGVCVDDPLDSEDDSILLEIHYFSAIVSTVKKQLVSKNQARTFKNDLYTAVPSTNSLPSVAVEKDGECAPDQRPLTESHNGSATMNNNGVVNNNNNNNNSNNSSRNKPAADVNGDVMRKRRTSSCAENQEDYSASNWHKAPESIV